jgi:hypothetical protein
VNTDEFMIVLGILAGILFLGYVILFLLQRRYPTAGERLPPRELLAHYGAAARLIRKNAWLIWAPLGLAMPGLLLNAIHYARRYHEFARPDLSSHLIVAEPSEAPAPSKQPAQPKLQEHQEQTSQPILEASDYLLALQDAAAELHQGYFGVLMGHHVGALIILVFMLAYPLFIRHIQGRLGEMPDGLLFMRRVLKRFYWIFVSALLLTLCFWVVQAWIGESPSGQVPWKPFLRQFACPRHGSLGHSKTDA